VIHLRGRHGLPSCNPRTKAETSYDTSQVTCKLCWNIIVRRATQEAKKPKKHRREAKQEPCAPARIIMQDGKALMPKKLLKILPAIEAARSVIESRLRPKRMEGSLVGAIPPLGSAGVPTAPPTEPGARTQTGARIG
jgi:hypothetical protein